MKQIVLSSPGNTNCLFREKWSFSHNEIHIARIVEHAPIRYPKMCMISCEFIFA